MNSAPLHHDVKFDELHRQVANNKQYQYKGRYLLLIATTENLKFVDRGESNPLFDTDLLKYQDWLAKRFPNLKNSLTMFLWNDDGKQQLFLRTDDKMSTMFIYYVLHHHAEKIIFKNPKHYESLSPQARREKMKILFPKPKGN